MADIYEIKRAVFSYYKIQEDDWASPRVRGQIESVLPREVFVLTCARHGHSDFAISHHIQRDRSSVRELRRRAFERERSDLRFVSAMRSVETIVSGGAIATASEMTGEDAAEVATLQTVHGVETVMEARRLRKQGWSYLGLSKRYRITPQQAAIMVGDRPAAAGVDRHG